MNERYGGLRSIHGCCGFLEKRSKDFPEKSTSGVEQTTLAHAFFIAFLVTSTISETGLVRHGLNNSWTCSDIVRVYFFGLVSSMTVLFCSWILPTECLILLKVLSIIYLYNYHLYMLSKTWETKKKTKKNTVLPA